MCVFGCPSVCCVCVFTISFGRGAVADQSQEQRAAGSIQTADSTRQTPQALHRLVLERGMGGGFVKKRGGGVFWL